MIRKIKKYRIRYRVASNISQSYSKDRRKAGDLIFLYIFKNVLIITLTVPLPVREGLEVIKFRTKTMKTRNVSSILIILLAVIRSAAQTSGCTDPLAINFNSGATLNDGSCSYNKASVTPDESYILDGSIPETSGLILWNGYLWTHNDNSDNNIYCLDTANGSLIKSYHPGMVKNNDWEEISEDENYIYIGDFGNNSGDRQDLKILRIDKSSLLQEMPLVDSIMFSYSDQTDFTPGSNNTDFDCEAFIVSTDSIYLFTKQWISKKTSLYALPKSPGIYTAGLKESLNVDGLVTGSVLLEGHEVVVLSGYSDNLSPFFYLLYDFSGNDFFNGNRRKIDILLPYHQVEGITTGDGIKFYVSNEAFSLLPLINIHQELHIFDLSPFLGNYLGISGPLPDNENKYIISPNPAHDYVIIKSLPDMISEDVFLINMAGQIVLTDKINSEYSEINISGISAGIYILKIGNDKRNCFKVIKE